MYKSCIDRNSVKKITYSGRAYVCSLRFSRKGCDLGEKIQCFVVIYCLARQIEDYHSSAIATREVLLRIGKFK